MPTPWKTEEIENESDFEILLRDRSVITKGVNIETSISKLLYRRGESSRIISTFYLAYRNIGMLRRRFTADPVYLCFDSQLC